MVYLDLNRGSAVALYEMAFNTGILAARSRRSSVRTTSSTSGMSRAVTDAS